MDRRKFLGNLFMLAAYASLPKILKDAPLADIPAAPGIGGHAFKIRLNKAWFQAGDVLIIGSQDNKQFRFQPIDENGAELVEVTNEANRLKIQVDYFTQPEIPNDYHIEGMARKLTNRDVCWSQTDETGNREVLAKVSYDINS